MTDHTRSGGSGEGGDPACWLNRICEECGAFREDMAAATCARCGTPFPGGGPADSEAGAPHGPGTSSSSA
jgi:hypothetical protein